VKFKQAAPLAERSTLRAAEGGTFSHVNTQEGGVFRFVHNWSSHRILVRVSVTVTDVLSRDHLADGIAIALAPWDGRALLAE
jgi:hypothetical protein